MFSNTEELLPVISFNAKASADEAKKHEDFVTRMTAKGYTQAGAPAVRVVSARAQRFVGRRPASRKTGNGQPCPCRSSTAICPAGKNKSIGNRERFLRRYKEQIRDAVRAHRRPRHPRHRRGEKITSRARTSASRCSAMARAAIARHVVPGNRNTCAATASQTEGGGGGGGGKGQASDQGEGEDDFVFALSKEEFMQVFFEDLALPPWSRTQLAEVPEWKSHRAGFTSDGTPTTRTWCARMRGALGAASRSAQAAPARSCGAGATAGNEGRPGGTPGMRWSRDREDSRPIAAARACRIPSSTRSTCASRNRVQGAGAHQQGGDVLPDGRVRLDGRGARTSPSASSSCSTSSSRGTTRKIELVFIRHHTQAQEVDEENFFHSRDRRHRGLQRPHADGADHPRALSRAVEHLRRAGQRRRQLAPRQRPLPRSAGRQASCPGALLRLRAGGRGRAEPLGGTPSCRRAADTSPCARPPAPRGSTRCSATCSAAAGRRPHERRSLAAACAGRRRVRHAAAAGGPSDWSFELIDSYHRVIRARPPSASASTPTRTSSRSSPPSR